MSQRAPSEKGLLGCRVMAPSKHKNQQSIACCRKFQIQVAGVFKQRAKLVKTRELLSFYKHVIPVVVLASGITTKNLLKKKVLYDGTVCSLFFKRVDKRESCVSSAGRICKQSLRKREWKRNTSQHSSDCYSVYRWLSCCALSQDASRLLGALIELIIQTFFLFNKKCREKTETKSSLCRVGVLFFFLFVFLLQFFPLSLLTLARCWLLLFCFSSKAPPSPFILIHQGFVICHCLHHGPKWKTWKELMFLEKNYSQDMTMPKLDLN